MFLRGRSLLVTTCKQTLNSRPFSKFIGRDSNLRNKIAFREESIDTLFKTMCLYSLFKNKIVQCI